MTFRSRYARFVVDVHPEERKVADVVADASFEVEFLETEITAGAAPVPPLWIFVVETVTFDERFSDAFPEDRASMIAAIFVRAAQRAPMGSETIPQRRTASLGDGVGADACET